ncbi:hypothetical protein FV219_01490 [Methylobacterium sp. WL122]|nr:hypothetical protein FV219_01490 [Methylobacterium sp. WL122]
MSGRDTVWRQISELEEGIADVGRWARVLVAMGCGTSHIHPGAAFAVGEALERLGEALEDKWNLALDAAREEGGGR